MFNGNMDTFQDGYDFAERITGLGWEILKVVKAKDTKMRYYLLKRPKINIAKSKRYNSMFLQEIYYGKDGRKHLSEVDRFKKVSSDCEEFYEGVIKYLEEHHLSFDSMESKVRKYQDKVDVDLLITI